MTLDLRRASLEEILALRHLVLRPELPPESAQFDGDTESETRHFGAFVGDPGEIAGCLSFVRRPFEGVPAYQLRGMATRPAFARRGVGTALLRFAGQALRDQTGEVLLWCNARCEAAPFYQRLGWTIVSAAFDVPTVGPHFRMVRR